jgi:enoyl-[acyl-carrier protein] reductase I
MPRPCLKALPAITAAGLAKRGIRVNTVSQAPTKTSAGTGIKGFDGMYTFAEKIAPLGNPTADECADYCVSLFPI